MGSTFKRVPSGQPLSRQQQQRHDKTQAEERQRRGMHTFTRPKRREEVMGNVPGQNVAQEYHRKSQVTGRKGK